MMTRKKILEHPTLQLHDAMQSICRPLNNIGIDYFCQVRIDNKGGFAALSNNTGYHVHYLKHHYYNCDIHMAKGDALGNMIVWDFVKRSGESEQMARDATEFGISHLITLVKKSNHHTDYFHFASSYADETINQCYLSHFGALEQFIAYFNDKVDSAKPLAHAFDIRFRAQTNQAEFITFKMPTQNQLMHLTNNPIWIENNVNEHLFTKREYECLHYLTQGLTAKEAGALLHISSRTVEKHWDNIKRKLGCSNKIEVIRKLKNIK